MTTRHKPNNKPVSGDLHNLFVWSWVGVALFGIVIIAVIVLALSGETRGVFSSKMEIELSAGQCSEVYEFPANKWLSWHTSGISGSYIKLLFNDGTLSHKEYVARGLDKRQDFFFRNVQFCVTRDFPHKYGTVTWWFEKR